MQDVDDLLPVADAAEQVHVNRDTMLRAAKSGKIKSQKIGRHWYVYASDLERWKKEDYRPQMAARYPVKDQDNEDTPP